MIYVGSLTKNIANRGVTNLNHITSTYTPTNTNHLTHSASLFTALPPPAVSVTMKWLCILCLLLSVISSSSFLPPLSTSYVQNLSLLQPSIKQKQGVLSYCNSSFHIAGSNCGACKTELNLSNNNDEPDGGRNQDQRKDAELGLLLPVSILSITSILASIGTIWSEYTVFMTGCGPLSLPDVVERSCYLGVLVIAGSSVFARIVTGGSGLAIAISGNGIANENSNTNIVLQQIRLAEWLSLLAIAGAFVALGSQTINGEQMDGMSGINVDMCRAIQQASN